MIRPGRSTMADEAVGDQIRVQVCYRVGLDVGDRVSARLRHGVALRLLVKSGFDDLSIKWIAGQIRQQANDQEE
jgi:hypothetical protein